MITSDKIERVRKAIRHRTQISVKTANRLAGIEHTKQNSSETGMILRRLNFIPWNPERKGNKTWIREWQYNLIMGLNE